MVEAAYEACTCLDAQKQNCPKFFVAFSRVTGTLSFFTQFYVYAQCISQTSTLFKIATCI